jgi:hypothetical protein
MNESIMRPASLYLTNMYAYRYLLQTHHPIGAKRHVYRRATHCIMYRTPHHPLSSRFWIRFILAKRAVELSQGFAFSAETSSSIVFGVVIVRCCRF